MNTLSLDKAFLLTWLLPVLAPSGTGTPPEAAYEGLYTEKRGRTTVRTHERRDTSGDKLCVSKGNRSCILKTLQTSLYLCGVFILDGKAGIPGGAAEGIRASDPHQPHICLHLQPGCEGSYFSVTVVFKFHYYAMAAKEDDREEKE